MEFWANRHDVKSRGVRRVMDDSEEADHSPVVVGEERRAPIGNSAILLVRIGHSKPVRGRREEFGADRAASLFNPGEARSATIAHPATAPPRVTGWATVASTPSRSVSSHALQLANPVASSAM
jgi:hypothetical protein